MTPRRLWPRYRAGAIRPLSGGRERHADSFGQLAGVYLERYARAKKRSWKTDEEILNRDVLPKWKNRRARI